MELLTSPNSSPPRSQHPMKDNVSDAAKDQSHMLVYREQHALLVPRFNTIYADNPITPTSGKFPTTPRAGAFPTTPPTAKSFTGRHKSIIASPTTTSFDPIDNLGGVPLSYRGLHAKPQLMGVPPNRKRNSILSKFRSSRPDSDIVSLESSYTTRDPPQRKVSAVGALTKRFSRTRTVSMAEPTEITGSSLAAVETASRAPATIHRSPTLREPVALHRPELLRKYKSLPEPSREGSPAIRIFQLDTNLNEMTGILASLTEFNHLLTDDATTAFKVTERHGSKVDEQFEHRSSLTNAWLAPESWDVKVGLEEDATPRKSSTNSSGSGELRSLRLEQSSSTTPPLLGYRRRLSANRESFAMSPLEGTLRKPSDPVSLGPETTIPKRVLQSITKKIPTASTGHVATTTKTLSQVGNYIIRVFREDNTFATLLCPFETTEVELLAMAGRKFFIPDISNYLIGVRVGRLTKMLDPNSKPVTIQSGLLLLSGYTERDNLRLMGREDLSFLYKFVLVKNELRKLSDEEQQLITRDFLYVSLRNMDLKTIPIVLYDHSGEIESLDVSNNASMSIPLDFLQTCEKLRSVSFVNNRSAFFPSNLLEVRTLARLDLERNFIREIPALIHHLVNLTTLELKCNQLSQLPASVAALINLKTLNLSSNHFSVFPEAITKLPKLLQLDLSYNNLTHLPDSIAAMTGLEKLDLSTNSLSESLPAACKSLVALQSLNIKYNRLSNIDVLGSLPKLEVLYSTKNRVSRFSDRMDKLRMFHLDRNPIIDFHFENVLPSLAVLNLASAKITSLPAEFLAKIPNIEKLVLDKNHLVLMPVEIGCLSKLVYLSCYGNNLESIPAEIGGLTSLQYLDLHSNNLQALPDSLWQLCSLYILNLSSNSLGSFPKPTPVFGRVPSSVSLGNKSFMDMTARRPSDWSLSTIVSGPTSRRNSAVPTLSKKKSVSSDERPGEHQATLADSLLVLKMGDNNLSDDIFDSVSLLTELKTLNLSYNQLIEIPTGALRRMGKLTDLYLSGNELASLPADDFEYLKALKTLHLNGNKLHALPAELGKMKHLQVLDVGSNQLKYNISNWPYDWNWHWNLELKYLNFSGNKRLEIRQSHLNLRYEDTDDLDDFTVLKKLRVLGLVDVTVTTPSVPDETHEVRVRTTATEFGSIGYGIADTLGSRDNVSTRDLLIERFRGREDEVLIAIFDGKNDNPKTGHKIAKLLHETFTVIFTEELGKIGTAETIPDAMRRAFLRTNKEINSMVMLSTEDGFVNAAFAHPTNTSGLLGEKDVFTGCCMTVAFIKDKTLYTANLGDTMALLARGNGEYVTLTVKHDPTNRLEFERIRAGGGYVSSNGKVDGVVDVSRAIGFVDLLPHIHAGPDISEVDITYTDESVIIATKSLWDHIQYESAVDIIRREKDPMLAAQTLRDYAISYGSNDKMTVIVVALGKPKMKNVSVAYEEELLLTKKRRERTLFPEDSNLRRLEEEIPPPVGELALVFTDIKGSTALWDTIPVAMRSAMKIHNKVMRRQLRIVGGYEVKTEGDAFMVSFPTPSSALLWCLNVQIQLMHEDWPAEILATPEGREIKDESGKVVYRGISVRMGAHWGSPVCERDIITRRMDYFGPMVNRASRISATADGGQITLSTDFVNEWRKIDAGHRRVETEEVSHAEAYGDEAFGELLHREASAVVAVGCRFEEMGEKKLKGLETPEFIHLVYSEVLYGRFGHIEDEPEVEEPRAYMEIIGIDFLQQLRALSLRLESLCSAIQDPSQDYLGRKTFSAYTNDMIRKRMLRVDADAFLNHLVTRIESSVALLQLRQAANQAFHSTNLLHSPQASGDVFELVDQISALMQRHAPTAQASSFDPAE